jgi:hypothetical protein
VFLAAITGALLRWLALAVLALRRTRRLARIRFCLPKFTFISGQVLRAPIPSTTVPAYDGLTEIWFDSLADYEAFFTSNNYLEKVRPDETRFTLEGVMVTDELVVIE